MSGTATYEALVARGCLCGTDRIADCPVHSERGDNRGIAAFFRAGMPRAFPSVAECAACRGAGLLYPDIDLENGTGEMIGFRPTLICPTCSQPKHERALVRKVMADGRHRLNRRRVFGSRPLSPPREFPIVSPPIVEPA